MSRIVVSRQDTVKAAYGMARMAAAYLLIVKPIFPEQLGLVVKRALELNELSRRHRLLSRELKISLDDEIFDESNRSSVKGCP